MTLDASRDKKASNPFQLPGAVQTAVEQKVGRKDLQASNMNRINASKGASNAKNEANHEKHIAHLAFLTPLLATLPDIMLHEHAREVASHVLSAAIEREQRKFDR